MCHIFILHQALKFCSQSCLLRVDKDKAQGKFSLIWCVNSEPCLAIELLGLQLLAQDDRSRTKFKKTINSWIVGINLSIGTVCAFEIEGLGESGGKWEMKREREITEWGKGRESELESAGAWNV